MESKSISFLVLTLTLISCSFFAHGQNNSVKQKRDSIELLKQLIESAQEIRSLVEETDSLNSLKEYNLQLDRIRNENTRLSGILRLKEVSLLNYTYTTKKDSVEIKRLKIAERNLLKQIEGMRGNLDSIELASTAHNYLSLKPYNADSVEQLLAQEELLSENHKEKLENYCCITREAFFLFKDITGYREPKRIINKFKEIEIKEKFKGYIYIISEFEKSKARIEGGEQVSNPFVYQFNCPQSCQK